MHHAPPGHPMHHAPPPADHPMHLNAPPPPPDHPMHHVQQHLPPPHADHPIFHPPADPPRVHHPAAGAPLPDIKMAQLFDPMAPPPPPPPELHPDHMLQLQSKHSELMRADAAAADAGVAAGAACADAAAANHNLATVEEQLHQLNMSAGAITRDRWLSRSQAVDAMLVNTPPPAIGADFLEMINEPLPLLAGHSVHLPTPPPPSRPTLVGGAPQLSAAGALPSSPADFARLAGMPVTPSRGNPAMGHPAPWVPPVPNTGVAPWVPPVPL